MIRLRRASALLFVLLLAPYATAAPAGDWARYVDPFIGTGGHGHTYPGATLPFGMVQLSPDTRLTGWDGCSGYHYSDEIVYGFSHTHLSGTGISDYGDILLMPTVGEVRLDNGAGGDPGAGYASRFRKQSERAEAGYYAVELTDHDVFVELTATERVGLHRYRLPEGRPAHVIVDLEHRDAVIDASLRVAGDREVEGHRRSTLWARDQVVYFVARFSRPFESVALAVDDEIQTAARSLESDKLKAALSFGDAGGELLVKVGISSVDVAGARRNLESELPGWDFDATRREARQRWNQALGKIEVQGGTEEQRTVFYTGLYHSLVAPNVYSDVDGRYRGMDGEIHVAEGRRHYTVFSLWDTFRATHPLYALIEPLRVREFVETFLAQYREGGRLPVWELAGNETDTMIGYHSVSVIADAWAKGIRGFDAPLALEAMVASAERDDPGLNAYRAQGFIGAADDHESVSKTLEYAYDDWCIASFAADLDEDAIAREFFRRSGSWRNLLDPATGFMRARRNQRWLEPFDPRRVDGNYTEANAWQYSLFVPHDVPGLIAALGGDERFVERLDAMFSAEARTTGRDQPDITGLIGQYAHGNEPSHHMAWLYSHAGRPDKSAPRVRQILDELYSSDPDGLSGNEDCGQMSSWYVFSAMGFYPVCPGSDEYVLGSPIFDRVTLHLEQQQRFVIRSPGAGSRGRYVASARLNGEPLERSYLRHREIVAGGELELKLDADPGSGWGRAPGQRPGARDAGPPMLTTPFAVSSADTFREPISVALDSAEDGVTIRYALGSQAPDNWDDYREPIVLSDSTTLHFRAVRGDLFSPAVEAYFHRVPHDWKIELAPAPDPPYTEEGGITLIDGRRGGANWRTGGWLGYEGQAFTATIDLGRRQPIDRVGVSFLQDVRSWIWLPTGVTLSTSKDGKQFDEPVRITHDLTVDTDEVVLREMTAELGGTEARFVRIVAESYGTIPDWHPGRGGAAWIFVDEIRVD